LTPCHIPLRGVEVDNPAHTFASLLIAGAANITFVSRQLGHTSSQITLGIYAHLLDREEHGGGLERSSRKWSETP
jgi:integrase